MTTMTRWISRAALLALPATAFACSKGPTEPPMPTLASIQVTPGSQALVSLGETVQLTAAGRSSSGGSVSAQFSWSSSAPNVATVSAAGLVTAMDNGSATIVATSGGITGSATITVAQEPASLGDTRGDAQGATAGELLDSLVSVAVLDALGSPITGVDVAFAPAAGAGSVDPTSGTSDADGRVATAWTLGEAAGGQAVTASLAADASVELNLTATAYAGDPVLLELFDGDAQIELVSTPLPSPIQVRALDAFGNGVPDVPVTFAISSDDALDATEVFTDLEGVAGAVWTLGTSLGAYQAEASVADSAVGDIVDLPGSPVTFDATAVAYAVSAVDAPPAVVGDTVTVLGMGFHPDPASNTVTIDGVAATIVGGTQTSLSVVIPSYGCVPVADRTFRVTRGSEADSVDATVEPHDALRLAVGGQVVLDDPGEYCLQFLPGGSEEYVVGLTSTRRLAGEMSFSLLGDDGVSPIPAPPAAPVARSTAPRGAAEESPELRLRAWEERFLANGVEGLAAAGAYSSGPQRVSGSPGSTDPAGAPVLAPSVGDVLPLRVPTITADPCNDYTAISARVLAVGPRVVIALDQQVNTGFGFDVLIVPALNAFITLFGDNVWNLATTYFGVPSDLDVNGGITLVFSPVVQGLGVPAFSTVVDHLAPATCPASDEGEIIYLSTPMTVDATIFGNILTNAPPNVGHHLTHIVQYARRLSAGGGALPAFLGEGQAETAVELIGMSIRGDQSRLDYGASVMNAELLGLWYRPRFDRLSYLFGWDGATGSVPGAPESCSLFGFGGFQVACDPEYAPGVAWGFMRYVTDRFGPGYPGGAEAFQQALVAAGPNGDIISAVESLIGESLPDLIVDWAMTLYADGRVAAGASPDLQFQSWDLENVYSSMPPEQQLQPATYGFSSFSAGGGVVGGGTSYTLISTGAAHGPIAVRARDPIGGVLSEAMQPRLWVVRLR